MTGSNQPDEADLTRLRMETELLALEVGHVRARLKTYGALEEAERACREDLASTRRRLKELRERHDHVHRDIQRLVRRLNASPAGFALRRRKAFRALLAEYGVGFPK
jgi:hypothetical protein